MNIVNFEMIYFPDSTTGKPVFNGSVYIGEPDTDPEVLANQKSVTVREEDGTETVVAQPINTGGGGVPLYNGSPVQLLVDGDYSMKVLDNRGAQVYYIDSAVRLNPASQTDIMVRYSTLADLKGAATYTGAISYMAGYASEGDGGEGTFRWDGSDLSTEVTADAQSGIYVPPDFDTSGTSGAWVRQYSGVINVKWFGAVGDGSADDTVALQAAENYSSRKILDLQGGTYRLTSTFLVDETEPVTVRNGTITTDDAINLVRLKNSSHTIRDMSFSSTVTTSGLGIIVEGTAPDSVIDHCMFNDIPACAIQVQDGADRVLLTNNRIDNAGKGSGVSPPFNNSIYINVTGEVKALYNDITGADGGIYFRGDSSASTVSGYECTGNSIFGTGVSGTQGISNQYGFGGRVSGNRIADFGDNAIDSFGGANIVISDNRSSNCKDGVFVGHDGTHNITVIGNTSDGDERGVRIWDGATDIIVANNSIYNSSVGGIQANDSAQATITRISIIGNVIRGNPTIPYGISLDESDASDISRNIISNSDQEAIKIQNSDVTTLVGNIAQDCGHSGGITALRHYSTSDRSLFSDNVIYGVASVGIGIDGGNNSTVRGTRWRSVTTGVSDAGTGTVTNDNLVM